MRGFGVVHGVHGAGWPGPARTVLVVEDEVLLRLMLAEHLRDCGYRVIEAGSAREADEVLASDTPLDVLLTDVALPDGNGFAIARLARQRHPALGVIVVSGTAQAAQEAADLCDGHPYFQKPYDVADLERAVCAVIGAGR